MKLKIKDKTMSSKPTYRKSNLAKFKGLLFRKNIREDEAHIFIFQKQKFLSFHMFFVFTPIDILFLDKTKKVVDFKKNFKPFTVYKSKEKSCFVIELKHGMIKKFDIEKNDILQF